MKQKRLDEFIKNHEMFVQELLEYAKSEPKSFRDSIAEIIRVMSDYTVLSKRVQELEELIEDYKTVNKELHQRGRKVRDQNKRYRELLEKIKEMTRYDDCREAEIYELVSDELEGEE